MSYTDQDTARTRQADSRRQGCRRSSSGWQPPAAAPRMLEGGRNTLLALAMIAVGVLLFLGRLAPLQVEFEGGMVLLTIASCFLFFSFWKRIYGLLIPGSILAGLSVGVAFADMTDGVSVLWGLALGFTGILLLGRTLFNQHSVWLAIPAVILFAVGVIVAATNLPGLFVGGLVWLPLLLVGAGLYLGWGRQRTG
ncbi:MAG: hypothetical protein U0Z44_07135 [Kouleothrix sp.]